MIGGSARQTVEAQMTAGNETIIIRNQSDLNEVLSTLTKQVGTEEAKNFMELFRNNIIYQLQSLPVSPAKFQSPEGPLREQIIDSISDIKQSTDSEGNIKFSFEIDHDLAIALDQGTGIFGEKGAPITVQNKYMFIPGDAYYAGVSSRLVNRSLRKSMGMNKR